MGLVYPHDDAYQRLDLWLADQERGVPLFTQLSIIRQVAETLRYAHANKVVHRQLSPRAVWVRPSTSDPGTVTVKVSDWQSAGLTGAGDTTGLPGSGVTSLLGAGARAGTSDEDWTLAAFQAPEGAWAATGDRVRVDVFALGALAYFILTGHPAATSGPALRERLREQGGLDLSPDLPQASSTLRALVLSATKPLVSERVADVDRFLDLLGDAERELAQPDEEVIDPLEATPGALLAGRFRVNERLGRGSTALGLSVSDLADPDADRVLKVALDDAAATRLEGEAEVLRTLKSPRVVSVVEGPISVGGRDALLLESAGPETLASVLRDRPRMSLDLLERSGTDLISILLDLDRAHIDHRDIKPANLGVRESRGDRTKHLVLFDFSLSRAAASAVEAGTPPYLDPFLTGDRRQFDSAAERYAASVVLFEMATGQTPVYGDGQSHPSAITDDATIRPDMFDPSVADDLSRFFRRALARLAQDRFDTASEMLTAWQRIFSTSVTTEPDESADRLAEAATWGTPLTGAGLTARALSAIEPYAVTTVGELLTVDPVRLSGMRGVADSTRRQITRRLKAWRERLGDPRQSDAFRDGADLDVQQAAEVLLAAVGTGRATSRREVARLLLGIGTDLEPFSSNAQIGAHLSEPVTPGRISQIMGSLQSAWAKDEQALGLLTTLADAVTGELERLGGVASPRELTAVIVTTLSTSSGSTSEQRLLEGILRIVLDRLRALERADAGTISISTRRRADGHVVLVATDPLLLDVAETLGLAADSLLHQVGQGEVDVIVGVARVTEELSRVTVPRQNLPEGLTDPARRVRLASEVATTARASSVGELHHRDLSASAALRATFNGVGPTQRLAAEELRDRVRVRFPQLEPLPLRPRLDEVVERSGLGLFYDNDARLYRSRQTTADTTGLESREATRITPGTNPLERAGVAGVRLQESIARRSFMAIGVPPDVRITRFISVAEQMYDAEGVDLTGLLLDAMKAQAEQFNVPWSTIRAADAKDAGSRDRQGLAQIVDRAIPTLVEDVSRRVASPGGPLLLTEVSPLARYGHLNVISTWSDLGQSRERAVWMLVPQVGANRGPLIDGKAIPLASPAQYVSTDVDWVDNQANAVDPTRSTKDNASA